MAKTKQILLTTTVKTTGAWQPNRLVSFAGKQAENGEAVLGTAVGATRGGNARPT